MLALLDSPAIVKIRPSDLQCGTHMLHVQLRCIRKFRQMRLEDIPRVHEIDVISFSLPWPEKSYQFELTKNPTTLAIVVELAPPGGHADHHWDGCRLDHDR